MPENPDDYLNHDEIDVEKPASRDPLMGTGKSRSLLAGRAFLDALGGDLTTLVRRLGRAAAKRRTRALPSAGGTTPIGSASGRALRRLAKGLAIVGALGCVTFAGAMLWALYDLPPEKPIGGGAEPSLLLEAANGEALGRVGSLKLPDAARADFPDNLVRAVISIEDRHFYQHWGFDPQGILRALRRNIAAGEIVEGGSTITQQLVKMRILGHERTLPHKLREALAALWLDVHLGKDEILTRYLNSVYLGTGAYGMAAAARLYFNKAVSELTLPEAAMLGGLVRSPSRDNPLQDLDAAQARAAVVIDAMRDNGAIDAATAADAKARPAVPHPSGQMSRAGTWFADWVAREAHGITSAFSGHLRMRTTLVPALQKVAEGAIADALAGEGAKHHVSQAALVAMQPDGAVIAMVGGRDYQTSQFNRAVDARRQPGSAFKLFVYLAALRKGFRVDDTIDAGELDVHGWQPDNFGDRHYGHVTLAEAFAESINTAAARLAQQVGLNQVITAARDLGLSGALPAVPSLALGAADVNLLDLTAAYAAVKAGKMPVKPWGIAGFGIEGQSRLQSMGPPIGPMQSLQPYQKPLLELLQGVVQHGTGRAAALDGFAAGKTGTTQNDRDAWFIGFNDKLITGVWVGNDDGTPMDHVTGGSLPAAIWKRFMSEGGTLEAGNEQQALPAIQDTGTPRPQTPPSQSTETPECDYQACARTYQSFRAFDCTYQPYDSSQRRMCEKNVPQKTTAIPFAPDSSSQTAPIGAGRAQCNVDVCANFYSSFDPSDCTYQPYGGGARRICDR
jgi:penicillin-binding protein 1A